jgi:hypothetical protein
MRQIINTTEKGTRKTIYRNPQYITSFFADEESGTIIRMADGSTVKVEESPTIIACRILEH